MAAVARKPGHANPVEATDYNPAIRAAIAKARAQ